MFFIFFYSQVNVFNIYGLNRSGWCGQKSKRVGSNNIVACAPVCDELLECLNMVIGREMQTEYCSSSMHSTGFPRILEIPGKSWIFSWIFQALETPVKSVWSWKNLEMKA